MNQETLRTLIVTLPLIIGAYAALRATKKIEVVRKEVIAEVVAVKKEVTAVHAEVRSGNELKTGELASAAESRRIEDIPNADRTAQEQRHLEAVPIPPKGHDEGSES